MAKHPDVEWGPYLPISIVTTLHAARIAFDLRKALPKNEQTPLLQGLFAFYTLSFGGTTTSALLLANPPGWLASNALLPIYTLIYLAIFKSPFDVVFQLLNFLGPLTELVLSIGDCISCTFAITSMGVEATRLSSNKYIASSYVGMLICGTLSGCGGGIFTDAFQLTRRVWAFRTPAVYSALGSDMKVCFSITSLYVFTTSPFAFAKYLGLDAAWFPLLSAHEAKTVCCSVLLGTMLYRKCFSPSTDLKTQKMKAH
ncbi:hypothetical protein K493DRAFT_308095 [Basidiobolus meristosporus CBS 931.73]|uniref:Uncharacterized protein n=1 Tax=Basidiobolus meristosporus CBS 931.73 TaxID=1314790 RepID=A0A1Y1X7N9_9FUNG|nr:hypothetical protein K493DRAFT_308095 [Basidiobolus meristosporus CBS 931.73]|eukprot:ORX81344.1 hypothetical protein K493DRAFT_308095 [Basidiobolus meristosporus CBS 931.73]